MVGVAVAAPSSEVVWVDRSATSVQTLRALGLESREAEAGVWMQFDAPTEALAALTAAQVPWSRHETGATRDKSGYTTPDEMVGALHRLVVDHPGLAEVVSLGSSVEDALCLRFGCPRRTPLPLSGGFWGLTTATAVSAELALDVAVSLVEGYGGVSDHRNPRARCRVGLSPRQPRRCRSGQPPQRQCSGPEPQLRL